MYSQAQDDGDDAMLEQAQPAQYTFELEVSFAGTKSSQVCATMMVDSSSDGLCRWHSLRDMPQP